MGKKSKNANPDRPAQRGGGRGARGAAKARGGVRGRGRGKGGDDSDEEKLSRKERQRLQRVAGLSHSEALKVRINDHMQEKRERRTPLQNATTLRVNATGTDVEEISDCDAEWLVYTNEKGKKITLTLVEFLPRNDEAVMALLIGGVRQLLRMRYNVFWSHMRYNVTVRDFLDSFLRFCPRSFDSVWSSASGSEKSSLRTLYTLVFRLLERIGSERESQASHMSTQFYGRLLRDAKLVTSATLLDVCGIYARIAPQQVSALLKSWLRHVPDLRDQFIQSVPNLSDAIRRAMLQYEALMGADDTSSTATDGGDDTTATTSLSVAQQRAQLQHDVHRMLFELFFSVHLFAQTYEDGATLILRDMYDTELLETCAHAFLCVLPDVSGDAAADMTNAHRALLSDARSACITFCTFIIDRRFFKRLIRFRYRDVAFDTEMLGEVGARDGQSRARVCEDLLSLLQRFADAEESQSIHVTKSSSARRRACGSFLLECDRRADWQRALVETYVSLPTECDSVHVNFLLQLLHSKREEARDKRASDDELGLAAPNVETRAPIVRRLNKLDEERVVAADINEVAAAPVSDTDQATIDVSALTELFPQLPASVAARCVRAYGGDGNAALDAVLQSGGVSDDGQLPQSVLSHIESNDKMSVSSAVFVPGVGMVPSDETAAIDNADDELARTTSLIQSLRSAPKNTKRANVYDGDAFDVMSMSKGTKVAVGGSRFQKRQGELGELDEETRKATLRLAGVHVGSDDDENDGAAPDDVELDGVHSVLKSSWSQLYRDEYDDSFDQYNVAVNDGEEAEEVLMGKSAEEIPVQLKAGGSHTGRGRGGGGRGRGAGAATSSDRAKRAKQQARKKQAAKKRGLSTAASQAAASRAHQQ